MFYFILVIKKKSSKCNGKIIFGLFFFIDQYNIWTVWIQFVSLTMDMAFFFNKAK